ncbi:chemotaxis protein CheW [Chrysiogenes arsenatis]|uniref:chemotaxis protein CheW n=1 Tax=Chrysiogenes arsenatis TaxID=309797 RepID=UPI000420BD21|nr:chemotaxis protein CheW [Chrysiogenes arsenatis]
MNTFDDFEIRQAMGQIRHSERKLERSEDSWGGIFNIYSVLSPKTEMNTLALMHSTIDGFSELKGILLESLMQENLAKISAELKAKTETIVEFITRNLFERTADVSFLATDNELITFLEQDEPRAQHTERIVQRLQEYRDKYTVYHDIMLLGCDGTLRVSLQRDTNMAKADPDLARATIASNEFYEVLGTTALQPQNPQLTYSKPILSRAGIPVGILVLFFDFEREMASIFENLQNRSRTSILLLLDTQGAVIASSDRHVPLGEIVEMAVDEPFRIIFYKGTQYICKTSPAKPYQGYKGLGWFGHILIPLSLAFQQQNTAISQEILSSLASFSPLLDDVGSRADRLNNDLRSIVLRGQVQEKNDTQYLGAILNLITDNGRKTAEVFQDVIRDLYRAIISSLMLDAEFSSRIAIDIMDRNLYERANDGRWWALTPEFREILANRIFDETNCRTLESILSTINQSYTVYTRIFVYDTKGTIVASSNLHSDTIACVGKKISSDLLGKVLALKSTARYVVSDFREEPLYNNRHTYTYHAAIRDPKGSPVGGIGLVFDSAVEIKQILIDTQPKRDGSFSLFCDRQGKIIASSSDEEQYAVGHTVTLDQSFLALRHGETTSSILLRNGYYYAVGATASFGYREYKTTGDYENDVIAVTFIPLSRKIALRPPRRRLEIAGGGTNGNQLTSLIVFYLDDDFYSLRIDDVVDIAAADTIKPYREEDEPLVGYIAYDHISLPVIDIRKLCKKQPSERHAHVIIAHTPQNALIGFLVEEVDGIYTVAPKTPDSGQIASRYLEGAVSVGKEIIFILSPQAIHERFGVKTRQG